MGLIYLLISIFGFIFVSFLTKLYGLREKNPAGINASLWISFFIISLVLLVLNPPAEFLPSVSLWGVIAGIGGSIAYYSFARAINIGYYGFSNAIYTCSFVFPVFISVIFWSEPLKPIRITGIIFVIFAIFLMTSFNKFEKKKNGLKFQWIIFALGALVFNAVPQISQATVNRFPQKDLYLFMLFASFGGLLIFLPTAIIKKKITKLSFFYGALAAIASYCGNLFTLKSLEKFSDTLVFPITVSTPMIAVVLLSKYIFKENLSKLGLLGFVSGIIGLILIGIK